MKKAEDKTKESKTEEKDGVVFWKGTCTGFRRIHS